MVFTKSLEIYSEEYSFKEQVVRVTVRTPLSGYRTLVEENRPKWPIFRRFCKMSQTSLYSIQSKFETKVESGDIHFIEEI